MVYDYTAYMDYMDLTVCWSRKAVKLNHSLTRHVHSRACTDSFLIWHKWSLALEGVLHTTQWHLTFHQYLRKSFCCDFVMKLLKYVTSCYVHSTAHTVLDEFFPYLAQLITSMKRCVPWNDLWPYPIPSRLFSCAVAYFMDYIHM